MCGFFFSLFFYNTNLPRGLWQFQSQMDRYHADAGGWKRSCALCLNNTLDSSEPNAPLPSPPELEDATDESAQEHVPASETNESKVAEETTSENVEEKDVPASETAESKVAEETTSENVEDKDKPADETTEINIAQETTIDNVEHKEEPADETTESKVAQETTSENVEHKEEPADETTESIGAHLGNRADSEDAPILAESFPICKTCQELVNSDPAVFVRCRTLVSIGELVGV